MALLSENRDLSSPKSRQKLSIAGLSAPRLSGAYGESSRGPLHYEALTLLRRIWLCAVIYDGLFRIRTARDPQLFRILSGRAKCDRAPDPSITVSGVPA